MNNYQKFCTEYSNEAVANAEKERLKKERHQDRFNYFNSILSIVAIIISLIVLFK